MNRISCMILAIIIILTGCSKEFGDNGDIAKDYLKEKGYKVVSYEGKVDEYQLTKEKLVSLPYMVYWALQGRDPLQYLGKTIIVERFIIKNHPLDNWKLDTKHSRLIGKGRTEVSVFIVDNQVIGGTSYPVLDEIIVGEYWSIDGKNLEDIYSISNFEKWKEEWIKSF